MWFSRNETPDNAVLQPIAFAGKSLASTETQCSNIEREAQAYYNGKKIVTTATLPMR